MWKRFWHPHLLLIGNYLGQNYAGEVICKKDDFISYSIHSKVVFFPNTFPWVLCTCCNNLIYISNGVSIIFDPLTSYYRQSACRKRVRDCRKRVLWRYFKRKNNLCLIFVRIWRTSGCFWNTKSLVFVRVTVHFAFQSTEWIEKIAYTHYVPLSDAFYLISDALWPIYKDFNTPDSGLIL